MANSYSAGGSRKRSRMERGIVKKLPKDNPVRLHVEEQVEGEYRLARAELDRLNAAKGKKRRRLLPTDEF